MSTARTNPPRYSVVVPVYNEDETLPELARRLGAMLDALGETWEVLVVDDASQDDTFRLLLELHQRDERFKPIRLARNFGHQAAISAGIDLALGDAVVIIDGDLQDPPEVVPELVARWREGYDVVYGVRIRREGESWFKRITAALFYRLLQRMAQTDVPLDAGDFRLVDRRVVDAFTLLRERNRYVRGMFGWVGFNQIGVPYERDARYAGDRKYSYRKSLKLAVDGIVSFSTVPLRAVLAVGFVIALGSFLLGLFAIVSRIGGWYSTPGWASLLLAIALLGGVQLILTGVVGLYVGRIADEVKARPLYVVREAYGLADLRSEPPSSDRLSPSRSDRDLGARP
ncbi:MAG TPA: glycosyltransferase family 2 protein [Gaiellaceae bacterium]|nr:glycosyltransferase family 2 protein [Gaiellaceae bacterium]